MKRLASYCWTGAVCAMGLPGCSIAGSKAGTARIPIQKSSPATRLPHVISEIYIHRTPGFTRQPEPRYGLTLQSDGTATYVVEVSIRQTGTYKAKIRYSEFEDVAKLVDACRFSDLDGYYGPTMISTDMPQTVVSVVSDGVRKTIYEDGQPSRPNNDTEAPRALTELENRIDAAVLHVKWVKVSDDSKAPEY